MTRKAALSIAFLSVTAVAVGWELVAVVDPRDDLEPWTSLIVDHVPAPITYAAIGVLVAFLMPHFIEAYAKKKGRAMATTTIPATPEPGAAKEPLVNPAVITAAVAALIAVVVAFGVDLTDAQTGAILTFVPIAATIVMAVWSRRKVFAPATVRAMVVEAAASGEVKTEAAVVAAEKPAAPFPGTGERLA